MNSDLSLPFSQNHSISDNTQTLVAMQYAATLKMCSMQNHYPPEKKAMKNLGFTEEKILSIHYIISNVCKADTTLLQHRIFASMTFPYHSTT